MSPPVEPSSDSDSVRALVDRDFVRYAARFHGDGLTITEVMNVP